MNLNRLGPAKGGGLDSFFRHSFCGSAFYFYVLEFQSCSKERNNKMKEIDVSRVIIEEYNKRLLEHLENDVVIVGSGPAGLAAAFYLSKSGIKTVVLEKRLSIGGGIWGGAAGCNVIVTDDSDILDEIGVSSKKVGDLEVLTSSGHITALGSPVRRSLAWGSCAARSRA